MWSSIELFLPRGFAEQVALVGSGSVPSGLDPARRASDASRADLVVVAPSASERRDRRWRRDALLAAGARLGVDGAIWLLEGTATLRRPLAAAGVRPTAVLLHLPELGRSRYVIPTGTAATRFALAGGVPSSAWRRRAAAALLRAPALAGLLPTSTLLRRPGGGPLGRWLFDLDGSRPGSLLVATALPGRPGAVVLRFADGARAPDAVAKVSPRARAELEGLCVLGAGAGRAGARTPSALAAGDVGGVPVVLESFVGGEPATELLARRRLSAETLTEQVAAWLTGWGRSSRRVRPLTASDLERRVLAPLEALTRAIRDPILVPHRDRLRALCTRVEGEDCPFVAAHGDLTAANLLLDGGPALGVVDWEEASPEALPLTDLFYAAADAVAAEGRYGDRVAAFSSCFARDGRRAARVERLWRRLAKALEASEAISELSFHACWLRHAANEAERSAPVAAPGPFASIVCAIAREPERYGPRGA